MRLSLCLYVVACLVVLLLADLGRMRPELAALTAFPLGDKIAHSLIAGFFAFLTNLTLLRHWPVGRWKSLAVGTLLVASLCTLEEASNLLTPYRGCELGDLVANYLGILIIGVAPFALHHSLVGQRVTA